MVSLTLPFNSSKGLTTHIIINLILICLDCPPLQVYPIISFVAELGGSLGLCLGVSFLSSWDLVDYFLNRVHVKSYLQ